MLVSLISATYFNPAELIIHDIGPLFPFKENKQLHSLALHLRRDRGEHDQIIFCTLQYPGWACINLKQKYRFKVRVKILLLDCIKSWLYKFLQIEASIQNKTQLCIKLHQIGINIDHQNLQVSLQDLQVSLQNLQVSLQNLQVNLQNLPVLRLACSSSDNCCY